MECISLIEFSRYVMCKYCEFFWDISARVCLGLIFEGSKYRHYAAKFLLIKKMNLVGFK